MFLRSPCAHSGFTYVLRFVLIVHKAFTVSFHCVFTVRSPALSALLRSCPPFTNRVLCVHCAFILRSAFNQLLLIVQSVLIYIHLELQSKSKSVFASHSKMRKERVSKVWMKLTHQQPHFNKEYNPHYWKYTFLSKSVVTKKKCWCPTKNVLLPKNKMNRSN